MTVESDRYPQKKKSVVFLLYRDGKVLLETKVPREYNFYDPYAGLTVIPGGKVEPKDRILRDKEFLNAAIREIREEFEVEVGLLVKMLETNNNINPNGIPYHTVVYLVLDWDGHVNLDTELYKAHKQWVDINVACEMVSVEFGKRIIVQAKSALRL